jgi:hypothetical protein
VYKITANILGPGELSAGNHNYGLGNQLFQIATVLSYAKDNNFKAIFPCLRNTKHYGNYVDNILRNLVVDDDMPSDFISFSNSEPIYKPLPVVNKSVVVHDSYLQSEKYFVHNRDLILDTLRPSTNDVEYLRKKYSNISGSISCHVRRGDYVHLQGKYNTLVNSDYYKKAIDVLGDGEVIVFSDDIDWCKENFKLDGRNLVFSQEEDYRELYLMSMCKHNIIANSTFSWWGAWLNANEDRKVIAPSQWFAVDHNRKDVDLIPQDWIVI